MVKNFWPGPDWVPAQVAACLGPLSHLLETEDQQLWRRHVDHVKSRATSPLSLISESEPTWETMSSSTLCGTTEPLLEVASETPNSSESGLTPVNLPNERATSKHEQAISDNVCTDLTSGGTR